MIIRFALDAMGVDTPTYVDVGAYHPYEFSNTAHFYEAGSRGINIEANPHLFRLFEKHRRHDINLNMAVMDQPGEMDFYIMFPCTMSTFSEEEANKLVENEGFRIVEKKKMKVHTLPQILSEHGSSMLPHFLSIDVEGAEEKIIWSIDFDVWSPLVICCETISFSTIGEGEKNISLIEYLSSQGYLVYADTHINTIFVLEKAWKAARRVTYHY